MQCKLSLREDRKLTKDDKTFPDKNYKSLDVLDKIISSLVDSFEKTHDPDRRVSFARNIAYLLSVRQRLK